MLSSAFPCYFRPPNRCKHAHAPIDRTRRANARNQGYELRVRLGNPGLVSYSLVNLGVAEFALGNYSVALAHFHQGLSISHGLKDMVGIGYFLFGLAELAEPNLAARLLGRFDQLREDIEISLNEEERLSQEALVEKLRKMLTPTEFESAWSEGRAMELERAIQEASNRDFLNLSLVGSNMGASSPQSACP